MKHKPDDIDRILKVTERAAARTEKELREEDLNTKIANQVIEEWNRAQDEEKYVEISSVDRSIDLGLKILAASFAALAISITIICIVALFVS